MPVITFASSKGGSGKSTIALNIAKMMQLRGRKVVALDADPQQSLFDEYSLLEPAGMFDAMTLPADNNPKAVIDGLKDKYEFVLIDTQGALDKRLIEILTATDLAVIPVKPSQKDVYAILTMVDLIKQMQEKSGTPAAAFLVNGAIQQTNLSREIFDVLNDYGLETFQRPIYQRVSYTDIKNGRCAVEYDSKARYEIDVTLDEILEAFS